MYIIIIISKRHYAETRSENNIHKTKRKKEKHS